MRALALKVLVVVVLLSVDAPTVDASEDFYRMLGVLSSATMSEIKKAYHKLSLIFHPDKNPGSEDKFMDIAQAYETLGDPDKRREYDNGAGHETTGRRRDSPVDTGPKPVDMHVHFPGGSFEFHYKPYPTPKPSKAPDITATAEVELTDVYHGTVVNVSFTRQTVCPHCNGTGADEPKHVEACPKCFGTGFRYSVRDDMNLRLRQEYNTTCHSCEGTGIFVSHKCPRCDGNKVIFDRIEQEFEIPEGAPDGHSASFTGQGDQGPGLTPGDLTIRMAVNPHPYFERSGDDLYYTINITLFEALLGFTKNVTHFDNRTVDIVQDAVSQPGGQLEVEDEGMPRFGRSGHYGVLVVLQDITFPKSLTPEEKEVLRSVLDEEEIKRLEEMLKRRANQDILAKMKEPLGHDLTRRSVTETLVQANIVDERLIIPFPGRLDEWRYYTVGPGPITFHVCRPAPTSDLDRPLGSYQIVGVTRVFAESAGTFFHPLDPADQITVMPGDVIGFRLEQQQTMSFDPTGPGYVRITTPPNPHERLGEWSEYQITSNRTYPFAAKVSAAGVLFTEKECAGLVYMLPDDDANLCDAVWLNTKSPVNDNAKSMLVPGGFSVRLFNDCGEISNNPLATFDFRQEPETQCVELPAGVSHATLVR